MIKRSSVKFVLPIAVPGQLDNGKVKPSTRKCVRFMHSFQLQNTIGLHGLQKPFYLVRPASWNARNNVNSQIA
jgi:hypothetical protein